MTPKSVLTRGHAFGHAAVFPALQEHYGSCRRGEQKLLFWPYTAQLPCLVQVAGH